MANPFPTIMGTRTAVDVVVPEATAVAIFDNAELATELPGHRFTLDLAVFHRGLASDGVTPSAQSVYVIITGDDEADSMMEIDVTAVRTDPWILSAEPLPTQLVFYCPAGSGGATLRVLTTVTYIASVKF